MKPLHILLLTIVLAGTACSDLRILSTPDGQDHPAPCAVTCAGVATPYWMESGFHFTRTYASLDISECGFTSPPIVTANLRVFKRFPNIHLTEVDSQSVVAYTDEQYRAADANRGGWKIHWVAIGHVC